MRTVGCWAASTGGGWAQTEEAQALRVDPTALAKASDHQLVKLLTVVIRQDRFVEGALAAAFETGLILGILRRVEQLAEGANKSTGGRDQVVV